MTTDRQLKIVIIDDNAARREEIKSFMPAYIDPVTTGYGEGAKDAIRADAEGKVPDLVIINGDDPKKRGLYIFEWMRNNEDDRIKSVPVIVLTEDEFSDSSLEYLELGDVTFYEGEIEEFDVFNLVTECISEAEFIPEPVEPTFYAPKSYDRVMGLSFKPLGDADKKRAVALNMDEQLFNLEAAIERGRQKTEQIKELISGALEIKENKAAAGAGGSQGQAATGGKKKKNKTAVPHFLNKVRNDKGLEPARDEDTENLPMIGTDEEVRVAKGPKENPYLTEYDPLTAGIDKVEYKYGSYEGEADPLLAGLDDIDDDGNARVYDSRRDINKKTIVVVDDSQEDLDACDLFLSAKYNVILFDGGQKAIEYFERSSADMLLLDTYMPNLGGVQTLEGIRQTPGGSRVPVIYMVDKRYPVYVESLSGDRVIGILQKPINIGGLSIAVEGYFRRNK